MANTLVTPKWISREAISVMDYSPRVILENNYRYDVARDAFELRPEPLPPKAVLALGAAAIVASPRKISRRSLFGMNIFGRKDDE